MDDFEELVKEIALKMFDAYCDFNLSHGKYITWADFEEAFCDGIADLQKRQEAVAWMDKYGNIWDRDVQNDNYPYPLFRFPPSCEAKVKELEDERDQLINIIADCRNAVGFGNPDEDGAEGLEALSGPEYVPTYIKKKFDQLLEQVEELKEELMDCRQKAWE